jgi:orotidine-5'-phosphate decarboxylase
MIYLFNKELNVQIVTPIYNGARGFGSLASLTKRIAPRVDCVMMDSSLVSVSDISRIIHLIKSFGGKVILNIQFHDRFSSIQGFHSKYYSTEIDVVCIDALAGTNAMKVANAIASSTTLVFGSIIGAHNDMQPRDLIKLARRVLESGCDGIVCTPSALCCMSESEEFQGLQKMVFGAYPNWVQRDDTVKTITEMVSKGANYIVVGDYITNPYPELGLEYTLHLIEQEVIGAANH